MTVGIASMADPSDIARAYAAAHGEDPRFDRNPLMELSMQRQAANPWRVPPPQPREEPRRPEMKDPRPRSATSAAEQQLSDAIFGAITMPYNAGRTGAELYLNATHSKPMEAGVNAADLAAMLAFRRSPKAPARTLEAYVAGLKERPSTLNYDTYLENPLQVINGRSRQFESQEPAFTRDVPQRAKNLDHWRNMDSLRDKRDAGLLSGPDGTPVNPWYWPAPLYDAFARELGPELAHERLSKFLEYNAATSMMTSVPRNVIEGWHVLHQDLRGRPINGLSPVELTGGAYHNKVAIAGQAASGEGIMGEGAHKIRNYSLNLHGVGTAQPEYRFQPGGEMERILQPATLDSIMAEAMKLRNVKGEPAERFVGPIYRHGVGTINGLGEEVGSAAADTQAAIWQQHQFAKHGTDVYKDSYARIFDDVIHRVAAQKGEDPKRTLTEMIHGSRPPNNIYSAAAFLPPAGIALSFAGGGSPSDESRELMRVPQS